MVLGLLAGLGPRATLAAPPTVERPATTQVSGRVREAGGSRRGVAGAVVLVVEAPADVRPGREARDPLDPDAVSWTRRAETDAEGNFLLEEVPVGKVRVVVVAGGYARLEQWAEVDAGDRANELDLYLRRDAGSDYRTEVRTERSRSYAVEPEHVIDAQQARRYAGSGDDPLLGAQNLPGVARSPLGLGMIGFRGGDPTEAGHYLDGHPIPRSFHILPIASVLSAPMVDRIELSPGNYSAAYGSFGGGLIAIESRPGGRAGIHGQAHLDLFDLGTTLEGPVGEGSVHVGLRRSHVGDILQAVRALPTANPAFWDYLGRFDHPLGARTQLTVRALGAGDRLTGDETFEFGASFHRFDLALRRTSEDWLIYVSPSLRLDASNLQQGGNELRRHANVYSVRAAFTRRNLVPWLNIEFGSDIVVERWRLRDHTQFNLASLEGEIRTIEDDEDTRGDQLRLGAWISLPMSFGAWQLVPALRANVFAYTGYPRIRPDPRVDLRGPVHERVDLHLALGMYSAPVVVARGEDSDLIEQNGFLGDGLADVPQYLIAYFEPNISIDVDDRSASATYVIHGSAGVQVRLPWELEARATGFWREGLPVTLERFRGDPYYYGRRRSLGLELLLRRSLANDVIDGWLGYTLMWARAEDQAGEWLPAVFDQRHNFVALLGVNLPRNVRVGARFRLVSGNPETPVVGREVVADDGVWFYRPLRAPRGTSYQPMFHQLDLRVDKSWVKDRTRVTTYLDVQNVYNRIYPEVWIYSRDWAERSSLIGLPIYPSLGVQVDF
ncbi:TonB-dependent Receptor Plug Domain protein [Enhygromyxa salina]|uniref:TonB-dependent Receptor Plug Domain protein n=2 Tax=Enhygromyxa salina TaxID=215803 RepID=A0A2S9XTJ7_9BACT|nr:TonB-dependent Receptor Plug Domain protein [Enhygromyxa salina]